jgi:crossover junction endodeoxyribonuclease RusA
MEPEFPIEFIVQGTPVSFQRANPRAKEEWRDLVRRASAPQLPQMHFASSQRMSVTLYYYPDGPMIGDIDNIIKLTLDAMSQHVYVDDDQVERVVIQKFEKGRIFAFQAPSETLAACMLGPKPALYIRISNAPYEDL